MEVVAVEVGGGGGGASLESNGAVVGVSFLAAVAFVVPIVACRAKLAASVCPFTSRAPIVTVLSQDHWKLSLGQIIVSWRCCAAMKQSSCTG